MHLVHTDIHFLHTIVPRIEERWGAGVVTQKNVMGEIGGWGRVPFNEMIRPVVKYHLRRGVGLIKFLENSTRPQPLTSRIEIHMK